MWFDVVWVIVCRIICNYRKYLDIPVMIFGRDRGNYYPKVVLPYLGRAKKYPGWCFDHTRAA